MSNTTTPIPLFLKQVRPEFQEVMVKSFNYEGVNPSLIETICAEFLANNPDSDDPLEAVCLMQRQITFSYIRYIDNGFLQTFNALLGYSQDENGAREVQIAAGMAIAEIRCFSALENHGKEELNVFQEQLDKVASLLGADLSTPHYFSGRYYYLLGCLKREKGKQGEALRAFQEGERIFSKTPLLYLAVSCYALSLQILAESKSTEFRHQYYAQHFRFKAFPMVQFKMATVFIQHLPRNEERDSLRDLGLAQYVEAQNTLLKM